MPSIIENIEKLVRALGAPVHSDGPYVERQDDTIFCVGGGNKTEQAETAGILAAHFNDLPDILKLLKETLEQKTDAKTPEVFTRGEIIKICRTEIDFRLGQHLENFHASYMPKP